MKIKIYTFLLSLLICSLIQAQTFVSPSASTGFTTTIVGLRQGSIAPFDMNSDGKKDFIISGYDALSNSFTKLIVNSVSNDFTDVSGLLPLPGVGRGKVLIGDVNNDGKPDIFLTGENTNPSSSIIARLYTNSGTNLTSVSGTPFVGVYDGDAAFADVNNDGFLDLLVVGDETAGSNVLRAKLYTNSGTNFALVAGTPFTGIKIGSVAFADVNNDMFQDVIITGFAGTNNLITKLYTNSGGNFTEVSGTPFAQVSGSKVAFLDANSDGKPDVFLSGITSTNINISKLYTNSGTNFTEVATPAIVPVGSGSLVVADFNNDTKPDIYLYGSDDGFSNLSSLYINTNGNFATVAGTTFTADFGENMVTSADFNGDGTQDLFISGVDASGFSQISKLYLNVKGTSIVTQPVSATVCGLHTFTVSASGTSLSYKWSNGAITQNISTSIAGNYMVTVTGAGGIAVSTIAGLTALTSTEITTQPIASAVVCSGSPQTLSVAGTGLNVSYRWSNGAITSSITTTVAGTYIATVSGTCGIKISNSSVLTAGTAPEITSITSGVAVIPGTATATVGVIATGAGLSYLWSTGATTPRLTSLGAGEYTVSVTGTCGTAIDVALVGNILIASSNSGYTFVTSFGSKGSENNQFNPPYCIALGPDGKIYVADLLNNRIAVWSQNGNVFTLVTTFGSFGSSNNKFLYPFIVNIAPDGKIYVIDRENNRVSVWTQNDNIYSPFATFGSVGSGANNFKSPAGISFGFDGKIYVADRRNHRINVWMLNGNTYTSMTTFGSEGTANDQFNNPSGVWVASDGKIYVTDEVNNRISVWTQSGNTYSPLTTFGSKGTANNQFSNPFSLSIASDGKIYVADVFNNRISVWTQSGSNFGNLTTFGTGGSASNQFWNPHNVAISSDAKTFYVADKGNHRVSLWKAPAPIFYFQITFDVKTPTTFTGNVATITWPTLAGVSSYCIRISKNNTFDSNSKVLCGLKGNSYTYNPNDPNFRTESSENEYFFQVAGEDAEGNKSQWSETQTFYLNGATSLKGTSANASFSIYPNPNAGTFVIDLQGFQNLSGLGYTISSVEGKIVAKGTLIKGKSEISTSLSKGIYFVKVGNGVKKLVIE